MQSSFVNQEIENLANLAPRWRRRMIDGWHRFLVVLSEFSTYLGGAGHSSRICDQFGTLFACAWVSLKDGVPNHEDLVRWCDNITPLTSALYDDDTSDHDRCLRYLLQAPDPDAKNGEDHTIGELIAVAAFGQDRRRAGQILGRLGLRVLDPWPVAEEDPIMLAVSNTHSGLARVFAGTHWGSQAGRTGVWSQMMRRLDGARSGQIVRFTHADHPSRAVVVTLKGLVSRQTKLI